MYDSYFSLSNKKYDTDINSLKKRGFKNNFSYNEKELLAHKDSIHILSQIKGVAIKFNKDTDLKKIIDQIKYLPNLEYLKIDNSFFLSDSYKSQCLPSNILELHKLKTIAFYYSKNKNFEYDFLILSRLKNLKNLVFVGGRSDILQTNNFLKLIQLEGIYCSARYGPIIPQGIMDFPNLKSFLIAADEYPNGVKMLTNLSKNKNLENLILNYVPLNDSISKSISNFKGLKKVRLGGKIEYPELLFQALSKNPLKELYLINNHLKDDLSLISNFRHLEKFYSINNKLTKNLSIDFFKLKKLSFIEIQGSEIEVINDPIFQLQNLETLKLYYNKIKIFTIGNSKIKYLTLKNNSLTELTDKIGNLSSLKFLDLSDNNLKALPNSITSLSRLDTLKLEKNYLTSLPNDIGNLKNLKLIDIEQNILTSLPISFSKLSKLTYLNITANDLQNFPENFGELLSLEKLKAEYNFLEFLPTSFVNLNNLKVLHLRHNNLSTLPIGFGKLRKLETLYLDNRISYKFSFERYNSDSGTFKKDSTKRKERIDNNIISLPSDFKKLGALTNLYLSNNENLNSSGLFEILKNSTFKNYALNISGCNIKVLPENGWKTISVKSLDISNNKIIKLPKDIVNSRYLTTLNTKNNPGNSLNTYSKNKEQLFIYFKEIGLTNDVNLPNTPKVARAYAEFSNKKYYSKQYEKSVEYAEKALSIDKKIALKYIYNSNLSEIYYKSNMFKKSIEYADEFLQKDTIKGSRFLNSILPNFEFKYKSQLALGDTLQAINTLKIASINFSANRWSEAGILAREMKMNKKALIYFNNSFDFYTNYLKNNKEEWAYHLSLLEAYIIADEFKKASDYLLLLTNYNIKELKYSFLLQYFKIILNEINGENLFLSDYKALKENLKDQNVSFKGWSFDLFIQWNELNNLNEKQQKYFQKLTNLLQDQQ